MDLPQLIAALSDPRAYPHAPQRIEVRQTHISAVFLAGPFVYKIKKPVELGFLDFRTLERRRHFCEEEVRLNRRLSPAVYLGVVPVSLDGGRVVVEGRGEVIEWAVKMARLPEDATLERRLDRGELNPDQMVKLARVVAGFHAAAESSQRISTFGRFDVVAGNARENFSQAEREVGGTVHPAVFGRLRDLTERHLTRLNSLIAGRAERGVPRDTHGDLHLDHVYLFPDRPPPGDLAIIDCIEFNERFRFADPVADMAFLVMDLKSHGRRDLAEVFADAYSAAAGDSEGRALLPFYTAYRAAVRGKVEGFELRESEIPAEERTAALTRARAHWLLALGELEAPAARPCLLLVGGLPGSGKSTLARGLAAVAGFTVLRSDVIRKELAGMPPEARGSAELYSTAASNRTYAECQQRAADLLFAGGRVIVDATFAAEKRRRQFLEAARRMGVPALWLDCRADAESCRQRLSSRHGDASDADPAVFERIAAHWQAPSNETASALHVIDSTRAANQVAEEAVQVLRSRGLF